MTNKRIRIHDLLNNEAEEVKQQTSPASSSSVTLGGSIQLNPSNITTPMQTYQSKDRAVGQQVELILANYNTSTYPSDSICNDNSSGRIANTSNSPLSSIPRRYSFNNTDANNNNHKSSTTSLPSTSRLLSNTISGPGPIIPLHLPSTHSQPPQLPNFQLKSELNSGIGGFSPDSSMSRSTTSLPMIGGIQSPGTLQPMMPSLTTPTSSLNHVSKPPHNVQPHRPHPLSATVREHSQHMASIGTAGVTHGKASPDLGSTLMATGDNIQYKINKPQGRPIIQSIIGKFTLYANIQDLILDITRFDRIRLRDVFNESLGPFELIRYSKEDLQLHHHNQNAGANRGAPESPNSAQSNVSLQKNLAINEVQVYDKLRQEFQCQYLKFIRIIRDKKGKLIRLESVIIPNTNEITIDFIKKKYVILVTNPI
ncbi:unnamed protein product [Kluyveromyces dobzhanskii CBS 2104]|uniref:WGS project CCBQ000000000 data, contig 00009 n=1 Tax=Kluyveromyces dobzhanskii CBS 2104 TaxID=1427455 RepID=A0A0A8L356_9SACH|nr:unnamed protein product [Kluyveromyces dobzhanskii CBS 2104]